MSNVQDPIEKTDTNKWRAIANLFLDEMCSSEEFLGKLKAVEDEELASSLINSSKDMARYLIFAIMLLISRILLSISPWPKSRK